MYDGSYVGFVNAHAKGDSSHNTLEFISQELVVDRLPRTGRQTGMVRFAPHPHICTVDRWDRRVNPGQIINHFST